MPSATKVSLPSFQWDKGAWTLGAAIFLFFWSYPTLLTLITSFKTEQEILSSTFALPRAPTLDAYREAWKVLNYSTLLWNSIFYAAAGSALAVFLAIVPATVFAWYPVYGRAALFVLLLTTMMLPQQTVIIPLFNLLSDLHLLDTRAGLVIVHGAYGIAFQVLVLTAFISSIPVELRSAALIDGCSDFGVIRHIVIPLALPAMAVGFTLNFIEIWKEYFFALVLLSSAETMPVNVGILRITNNQYFTSMNLPAAAVVLAQLPIIVLFIFAYRTITQGFYAGAVKG